jgi:hypothetical protein
MPGALGLPFGRRGRSIGQHMDAGLARMGPRIYDANMLSGGGRGRRYAQNLDGDAPSNTAPPPPPTPPAPEAKGKTLLESYEEYLNKGLDAIGVAPVILTKDPQLRDVVWGLAPFVAAYVIYDRDNVRDKARSAGLPL